MKSCRSVVSVFVVVVGLLGLSACGGDKPPGLPLYTPGVGGSSPTNTSKWTPEQQQVIDGYDGFNSLVAAIWSKDEKIDMAKAHQVAGEPFITKYLQNLDAALSAGLVLTGKVVNTISSVTVVGGTATINTCVDATHTKLTNPGNPSAPTAQIPPPSRMSVSMVRKADSWLVTGLKGGNSTCVSG